MITRNVPISATPSRSIVPVNIPLAMRSVRSLSLSGPMTVNTVPIITNTHATMSAGMYWRM